MDLTFSDESFDVYGDGYLFSKDDLRECSRFYRDESDPRRPLVSPVYADVHGLPPALIMTAECDPVRDPGERYAARTAAAGVHVRLQRWDGMVHGAMEMDALLPDVAERYRAMLTEFLDEVFGRSGDVARLEVADRQ